MGWTVTYQFVRAERVSDDELGALSAVVAEANAQDWDAEQVDLGIAAAKAATSVIAEGTTKLAMSLDESDDATQIVDAINAMLEVLPGASLRVVDDFDAFGADEHGRCSLEGDPTEPPLDIAAADLTPLTELASPEPASPEPASPEPASPEPESPEPESPELTSPEPASPEPASPEPASPEPASPEDPAPQRRGIEAQLEALPVAERARVGLSRYRALASEHEQRRYVLACVEQAARAGELDALVEPFLETWRNPKGLYFYGDLYFDDAATAALGTVDAVRDQMALDVTETETADGDSEMVFRRGEAAVRFLVLSGHPVALAQLLDLQRRYRDTAVPWRLRSFVLDAGIEQLAKHPQPAALATLMLAAATSEPTSGVATAALRGVARLDGERAVPLIECFTAEHVSMVEMTGALADANTPRARELLRELLGYPERVVRDTAGAALAAAGESVGSLPGPPPPEQCLRHPDENVRRQAIDTLLERRDRALFVSLALADALSAEMQCRRYGGYSTASFESWSDILPETLLYGSLEERLAWAAGEGAGVLGPQTILDELVAVHERGVNAIADTQPPLHLDLGLDVAALRAEEAAALSALTATAA